MLTYEKIKEQNCKDKCRCKFSIGKINEKTQSDLYWLCGKSKHRLWHCLWRLL